MEDIRDRTSGEQRITDVILHRVCGYQIYLRTEWDGPMELVTSMSEIDADLPRKRIIRILCDETGMDHLFTSPEVHKVLAYPMEEPRYLFPQAPSSRYVLIWRRQVCLKAALLAMKFSTRPIWA